MTKWLPPILAGALFCCASTTASEPNISTARSTNQTWAQAANRVCLAYAHQAKALGVPPVNDLDGSARWLQKAIPLIDAEIAALSRLQRPSLLASRVTRWIGLLKENEQVTRQILAAEKAHNIPRLATLGQRSVVLYRQAGQIAQRLRVPACAEP